MWILFLHSLGLFNKSSAHKAPVTLVHRLSHFHFVLYPSTCELVEQFFIQSLICFLRSHWQENVATNEFMNDFTICRQTTEDDVAFFKLHHHVFDFPVNIPGLKTKQLNIKVSLSTQWIARTSPVDTHFKKYKILLLQLMKAAVLAEIYYILSNFIAICRLQRCLLTVAR